MTAPRRYCAFSAYLRERFGGPVRRISLDAGFSCPNRDGRLSTEGCHFCLPRSYASAGAGEPLAAQLNRQLAAGRARGDERFMAYFQAYSNTYAPLERLRAAYDTVRHTPGIVALAVGTRPDCLGEGVLELLAEYTDEFEVWLELGLQSAHDATLAALNRGHDAGAFGRAVDAVRKFPALKLAAHVILGLPGEDETRERTTADALAAWGVDGVKLHPLYVPAGTRLAAQYDAGTVSLLTREEYARRAAGFLERLSARTVILRLSADCPAEVLRAPDWLADKAGVIAAIEHSLEAADAWQGGKCLSEPGGANYS